LTSEALSNSRPSSEIFPEPPKPLTKEQQRERKEERRKWTTYSTSLWYQIVLLGKNTSSLCSSIYPPSLHSYLLSLISSLLSSPLPHSSHPSIHLLSEKRVFDSKELYGTYNIQTGSNSTGSFGLWFCFLAIRRQPKVNRTFLSFFPFFPLVLSSLLPPLLSPLLSTYFSSFSK
jgi:hypothetical protein